MKKLLAVGAFLVLGCGGADGFVTPTPTACTPGESVACVGPGGSSGGQICNAEGTAFGACQCDRPDTGTPPADTSTPSDTTPPPDTYIAPDTYVADTSVVDSGSTDSGAEAEAGWPTCGVDLKDGDKCTLSASDMFRGTCHGTVCCKGCWDGTTCQVNPTLVTASDSLTACGSFGSACLNCKAGGGECTYDTCNPGDATKAPSCGRLPLTVMDGKACSAGVCSSGVCSACGGNGQMCCPSPKTACSTGFVCNSATATGPGTKCVEDCGTLGKACCKLSTPGCTTAWTTCGTTSSKCEACGDTFNAPCPTPATPCKPTLQLWEGRCSAYGGYGQPCAAGGAYGTCHPGLTCTFGSTPGTYVCVWG